MEIRTLKNYLVVAQEENLTKAAERLHLTQSTLSRQLAMMEEELGVKLFKRTKSIVLTDAGMLLKSRAESIIDLVDKTENEFKNLYSADLEGMVSIGCGVFGGAELLPELLCLFSEMNPKVRYDIVAGNVDSISAKLDKGTIDIGILLEPIDIEKYDYIRVNRIERWGLMLPADHKLAAKSNIMPSDIKDLPLIVYKRYTSRRLIENWYGAGADELHVVATYDVITNVHYLIEKHFGYAVTTAGAAKPYLGEKFVFCPFYPVIEASPVLIWKKGNRFSEVVKEFLQTAKSVLQVIN